MARSNLNKVENISTASNHVHAYEVQELHQLNLPFQIPVSLARIFAQCAQF